MPINYQEVRENNINVGCDSETMKSVPVIMEIKVL